MSPHTKITLKVSDSILRAKELIKKQFEKQPPYMEVK